MNFFANYPIEGGGGGGGGVTTLNGLSGALTLVAGSGITITPSGSTITIASSSTGANTFLSNLTSPVAINQSLTPGSTGTLNLGSATFGWNNLFVNTIYPDGSTAGVYIDVVDSRIYDSSAVESIDWTQRYLIDNTGSFSINWQARQLDFAGVPVANWNGASLQLNNTMDANNFGIINCGTITPSSSGSPTVGVSGTPFSSGFIGEFDIGPQTVTLQGTPYPLQGAIIGSSTDPLGVIAFGSSNSSTGNSANVYILTADSTAGTSGNITLITGTGSSGNGNIAVQANGAQILMGAVGNVLRVAGGSATAPTISTYAFAAQTADYLQMFDQNGYKTVAFSPTNTSGGAKFGINTASTSTVYDPFYSLELRIPKYTQDGIVILTSDSGSAYGSGTGSLLFNPADPSGLASLQFFNSAGTYLQGWNGSGSTSFGMLKFTSSAVSIISTTPIQLSGTAVIGTASTTPQHSLNTATATPGTGTGTITNLPAGFSGNPTGYISILINGGTHVIPYW